MTVTATNLIAGPVTEMWVAVFGSTEPALIGTDPAAPFRAVGGTMGGVKLVCDRSFFALEVDQVIQRVGSVPTGENFSIQTSMAEGVLKNFALAIAGLDTDVTTGTGTESLEFGGMTPGLTPNYMAIILDGRAPNGKKRRVTLRKALSTASVEQSYEKAGQTVIPVTFTGHYVSSSIRPIRVEDETS